MAQEPNPADPSFSVADLSTGHLTEADAESLSANGNDRVRQLRVMGDHHGFFVSVPCEITDEMREQCPASLLLCLEWAQARSFDYVLFDCDAEFVAELPAYDW